MKRTKTNLNFLDWNPQKIKFAFLKTDIGIILFIVFFLDNDKNDDNSKWDTIMFTSSHLISFCFSFLSSLIYLFFSLSLFLSCNFRVRNFQQRNIFDLLVKFTYTYLDINKSIIIEIDSIRRLVPNKAAKSIPLPKFNP